MRHGKTGVGARSGSRSDGVNARLPSVSELDPIDPGRVRQSTSEPLGYYIVTAGGDGVPYFELRLHLPSGTGLQPSGSAVPRMLAATFLGGTAEKSSEEISRTLQRLGATLSCSLGADGAVVSAGGLADNFEAVLELMSEVIFSAEYPSVEVEVARSRVMQALAVERAQPSTIARDHLKKAIYKNHPYGRPTPLPRAAAAVSRKEIARLHRRIFRASGARFVVVSSLSHNKVIHSIRKFFDPEGKGRIEGKKQWQSSPAGTIADPKPDFTPRTIVVDRPGAVQSTIRVGMPAPRRTDAIYHAFSVANTVFGGYFSSRLVENLREDKGYTYGISSALLHRRKASMVTVACDVATEVTAQALIEIFYEIDRLRAAPPSSAEIESARRYLLGATAISLDTYEGMARSLDSLFDQGLDETYLRKLKTRLWSLSPEEVHDAACLYLDRRKAVTVVLGDAARIVASLQNVLGEPISLVNHPSYA